VKINLFREKGSRVNLFEEKGSRVYAMDASGITRCPCEALIIWKEISMVIWIEM
jgi:hypothetical protein